MRSSRAWLMVCALAPLAAMAASAKPKVVVLPFNGSTPELTQVGVSVAEQVLTELGRDKRIDAVGASDVQTLMGVERQKALLGCSEEGAMCLAEISSALGAPWVIAGSLGQFGKSTRLDIKLIRAKDGKVVFRDGMNFKDDSALFETVSELMRRLLATFGTETNLGAADSAGGPPAGGIALLVAGGAAAVGGGLLLGIEGAAKGTVLTSLQGENAPTYSAAREQLTTQNTLMLTGGLVAAVGVAMAATGVVVLATTPKPPGAVSVVIGPGSVVVRGAF